MVGLPTGFRTRTRSENCLPIIHDSAGASPGTTDSQHRRPRPRPSHATLLKCLLGVALAMLVTYEVWQLGGSGAQLEGGLPTPRGPLPGHRAAAARGGRVEFGAPGLFVPLQDALDLDFPSQPAEVALLGELPPGGKLPPGKRDEAQMTLGDVMKLYVDTAGDSDRRRLAGDDVSGEVEPEGVGDSVRILVGVTSACCSPRARARRDSVRRTWIKRTRALHPDVDIVFFLSQPENASVAAKALGPIAEELAQHGDIVIVRGPDTYMDLPNKTFRMLRFGHAHPKGYTHILKTDDDCYLRVSHLLKALRVRPAPSLFHRAPRDGGGAAGGAGASPSATRLALERLAARQGLTLHTDGLTLYNDRGLEGGGRGGPATPPRFVDDEEGHSVSVAALAAGTRARAARMRARARDDEDGDEDADEAGAGQRRRALAGPLPAGHPSPPRAPDGPFRLSGVYLGCMENKAGFHPIRDPASKWYVSEEQLPNSAVPFGVKYLAGWGYVLSRDLFTRIVHKTNLWAADPESAPAWYTLLAWEDVLIGMMLMDVVDLPEDHRGFRAAWRSCPAETVLRHLDVDAPALLDGLYAQEESGLWGARPVQCSSGKFLPGDYSGWKAWRDTLPFVERL
ncbi:hypothetical protein ACKKBG_A38130 [Auxenochlorella protothecoides x Auxenochlorella symbiontica]